MERGTLVVIYWWDALDESSWTPIALIEIQKPPLVKSVGWFLSEDDDCVRLLDSVVGNEAGYSIIPKGTIKQIETVRDDELEVPEKEE